ncbi:hypothetical protein ACLB2K_053273 [Fragaria x ananassa]
MLSVSQRRGINAAKTNQKDKEGRRRNFGVKDRITEDCITCNSFFKGQQVPAETLGLSIFEGGLPSLRIGAVLTQEGHPVAYMSKALAQKHLALSMYDKEMLAVFSALHYKNRVYLPNCAGWHQKIISEFHDGFVGGHAGRHRTYKRVQRSSAWPGLHRDVKKYVVECDTCQRNHGENVLPPGHLQPLSIPAQAWQDITMDFIEALPKAEAESLAHVFVKEVSRLHGMPSNITSDRDPIFMSLFWDSFFQLQGTKLSRSSAYYPQSDGQTENLNKTLEQFLRCVVGERPQLWVQARPAYLAYHSSIQMSPFEVLYGYQPLTITTYLPGSTFVARVDMQLKDRNELLALFKKNLEKAKNR